MAISNNPAWKPFRGARGSIAKTTVFKQYGDKTVATKYPDMSRIKKTPAQLEAQQKFAAAVKFAQEINNDPEKKAAYPVRRGKSVFNTAVSDYMARE